VFHSPQASQRPAHFAETAPQDWQTKAVVEVLAMRNHAPWFARAGV
jgi:hypothetical protein